MGSSSGGSIEGALVDTRVFKCLAIANMRVLTTIDEMEKTANEIRIYTKRG